MNIGIVNMDAVLKKKCSVEIIRETLTLSGDSKNSDEFFSSSRF